MSMREYARSELERAGLFGEDSDYGGMVGEAVMRLIDVHDEEGHSGYSNGMAVSLFERLARFQPLTPLTGADDEWMEVSDGLQQNRRCSSVFRGPDGEAYDIDAVTWRDSDGSTWTGPRTFIAFPYTPETIVFDRPPSSEEGAS